MKAAGKKSSRRSNIESENTHHGVRDQQSRYIKKDGKNHLRNCASTKTFEKLGSCFVANGKQEQEKERFPENTRYHDPELSYCNTRKKASDHRPQLEGTYPKSPHEMP